MSVVMMFKSPVQHTSLPQPVMATHIPFFKVSTQNGWPLTSVARRTVSVRSPMRIPLSPAHAMSVTLGS